MGVERHESSSSANAIRSKMVRGVAGLSNILRGRVTPWKPQEELKTSDYSFATPKIGNLMRHIGFRGRKRSPGERTQTNEGKAKDVLWECQKQLSHGKNHGMMPGLRHQSDDFLSIFSFAFSFASTPYSPLYKYSTILLMLGLLDCCRLHSNL